VRIKGFKKKERKKSRKIWGIKARALDMILEAARETYPNEFSGTLRARDGVIIEVVMLPGTIQGETTAILQLHMLPVDYTVVGSVHSHPSGVVEPSDQDLILFEKFGRVHLIVGRPYNRESWKAFNHRGDRIELEIVE
jgi:proteasome lid subunit RPN8/RPN11